MTTELVILLSLFVFVLLGAFLGPQGPKATFEKAGPYLGARLERQLETGSGFRELSGGAIRWGKP